MPARVSPYVAIDWLLTGRIVDAQEALSHGAISRISEGTAREEALRIAEQIAGKDLAASQTVKAIVRRGLARQEAPSFAFQQGPVERLRQAAARR